jgi:hypothetical protein
MLETLLLLTIGFCAGYGVREFISVRRQQRYADRRRDP